MPKSVRKGRVDPGIEITGKTVIITGANTGLGLIAAIDIAKRGAKTIMACRNLEKGKQALDEVTEKSGSANVTLMELDLSSLESVRKFAASFLEKESRLDVLMNNAGVCMCPYTKSVDGFEMQFATNHLGHFLLTNLLLDVLKRSAPSRVVTVSSQSHRMGGKVHWNDVNLTNNYTPAKGYAQSKLMNILFSRELANRMQGTGVTTYSLHPGAVKTDLQRHLGNMPDPTCSDRMWGCFVGCIRPCFKDPETGAVTQVYCAIAPELENESGKYYSDCKVATVSNEGRNDEYAERLWTMSEKLVGLSE